MEIAQNQLGIDSTRAILKSMAQMSVVGIVALSDGFQIDDIAKFMGLYPQAANILGHSANSIAELKDLQFDEGIDLAKEILDAIRFVSNEIQKINGKNPAE